MIRSSIRSIKEYLAGKIAFGRRLLVAVLVAGMVLLSFTSDQPLSLPAGLSDTGLLFEPVSLAAKLSYPAGGTLAFNMSSPPESSLDLPFVDHDGQRIYEETRFFRASFYAKKKLRLYQPIIHEAASRHEIDPNLVKAIIMAESGYNPRAISKSGAKGLMQLMPSTAEALGVKDIFDPEHNINGGVLYFKRLVKRYNGDVKLALAAYNAGSRMVSKYQGIPPYRSTRFYIQKVFIYYDYFRGKLAGDLNQA